ncbi:hypothetical protein A3A14_00150 [Candidatus Daviesbacteria bacterium RIFCSPLOWO2_01_FULL_43_38]|uniref:Nudix hydrolase domain-containing protein n=2 Tax=Candidatus Daviesiibacteriota TaxID=1752718 RepID=A0A1F5K4B8_9BACT|nr:MAG: NUDIX hydrolase [Candidatus Daviesbacteria bacterium GW2011_GWA2_42_7]OGE20007.1 MAG: hypothetical protein A2874_00790 [Candidatus Daviesbacteria bacterium RIFCSPHIGHO2_01_FULL_43_17]OGE35757.1 MAG: hypothetical protein A3E45_00475 [Candidatus Daviesbacteria bacterium RIFCSPHIGHO2_12_FULL_43_11]OGE63442.1 MAG: hypothetical protein A3A14_00150 [Candidatus Daviesbacteria bacterium RIFCSPLOWO2_01_FULL_43_38]OGE69670.1 MAG: hypothetical protein A3J21_03175 [Candidatus Daviesbacteria bacteri
MDLYHLPDDKAFLISVKGLIFNSQGQLLVLKANNNHLNRNEKLKWDLPGGLVDFSEDLSEGLIREIKEECGLNVEVKELVSAFYGQPEYFIFKNGKRKSARIICLGFICIPETTGIRLGDEHDLYKWVDLKSIKSLEICVSSRGLIDSMENSFNFKG